jgi:hypothetical protein
MAHLFSCGRHGVGKFEPTCEYCLRAKNAYWAAQKKAPEKKSEPIKNLPMPPAISARVTDPETAHEGVAHISESQSENRALILALNFPPQGLNYREISALTDIYPTTCSRVITTMYRQGDLRRIGKDEGGYRYVPENGLHNGSVSLDEGEKL